MLKDKEAITKRNVMSFVFICALAIFLVFMFNVVNAAGTIFNLNITLPNASQLNYTYCNRSFSPPSANNSSVIRGYLQEDVQVVLNFSFSHISAANLTGINITFPLGFIYTNQSNKTGNTSGAPMAVEANIHFSYIVNDSGEYELIINSTNSTGWIINASATDVGFNNLTFISFNITPNSSGKFNMTLTFFYNNTFGLGSYNHTFIQFDVNDTTRPKSDPLNITITDSRNVVSNNTEGYYHKGVIILNTSILDNGNRSNLDVYFNLTNSSGHDNLSMSYKASNSSTFGSYNYSLDSSLLPDGNYTIRVVVNDTNNNQNHTAKMNFTIDNTPPTGTMACSPVDSYVGSTVTCTCTSADSTSGVSSTTYTASPSTTNAGTGLTQTCTILDRAGNTVTATSNTYNVWGSPSGSTGPSGGSTTPTETKTTTISEIVPGTPKVITSLDGTTNVKEITIEVSSTANNVKVDINKYSSKPSEVSVSKSGAYKYLKINTQNLENKLSKATMKIYVEKSWVSSLGMDKENVALFKYDESASEWNELTTTYDSEDSNYYYYTVEVNSFSYFSIAPKQALESEEPETGGETTSEETNLTWLWIIIGVVVLAIIIGGGVALKKKRR